MVMDALGSEIGTIYVDPNGKITGQFSSEPFRRKLNTAVTHELIDAVILTGNFTRKRPPWEA
jgi:predicted TIM-barrel enzyme